ncbi:pLS20_p028 family conjugation system transmembrane protein [Leuconostoc citreum]
MLNTLLMTLPTGGPTTGFYQDWSQYLSPMPHIFLTLVMLFMHSIALIFYYLGSGVLEAYQSSFKLLDFLTIFFSPNNSTYQNWNLGLIIRDMIYLGFVIFGLMMIVQWIKFIITDGRKGREWPKGISITMAIITAMPLIISMLTTIGTATSQDVMGKGSVSVLTKLWEGNSTDLRALASNNFDMSEYKKYSANNKIDRKKITGSDYHSVMSDQGYTDGLNDDQKKVFTKKIGGGSKLVDTTGGTLVLGKTFADEYPVMKTNWLGIIAGEIVFIFVVCGAIMRLFSSIYKMAFMSGSIVYFGLRDGTQGKRAQQILSMIEGQITGIVMMPISLVFFFAWIEFAFNTINALNLTVWPFTILSIAALYAGGKGLFSGFEMIEQWTGVRSGHNPVASMMLASQASRMVGGMAKSAKQNIGKGLQAVSPSQQKKNRESAQNLANRHPLGLENANTQDHTLDGAADQNGNTGKVATFASGLGRVAGAAKNPSQLAKSTGQAALSGAKSTGLAALNRAKSSVKKTVDGAKNYAGGIQDGYEGGQQAVDAFNRRHTPVDANRAMEQADTNHDQTNSARDVLSQARTGIERQENGDSSNEDNTNEHPDSTPIPRFAPAPKPTGNKKYLDGGTVAPLNPPADYTGPTSTSTISSSHEPSMPSSQSQFDTAQGTGMSTLETNQAPTPKIPITQMTKEQRRAHDQTIARAAIDRSIAKYNKEHPKN